jgi:hypothetical protein
MSNPQTIPLTGQISGQSTQQRITALRQPIDANGEALSIGDRVSGSWSAGKDYIGIIQSFEGRTKIKAQGIWVSGRRSCDSNEFNVLSTSLVKRPPEPAGWNATEEGQQFWNRVNLVWPWLTHADKQTGHFDRALDYPRSLHYLELIESRRQTELDLEHPSTNPPEQNGDDIASEIKRLRKLGVAKTGVWIEVEAVKGRNFRQAKWVSETACFQSKRVKGRKCKTQYIGKEDSPKHKRAIARVQRRNQIKSLLRLNHE